VYDYFPHSYRFRLADLDPKRVDSSQALDPVEHEAR